MFWWLVVRVVDLIFSYYSNPIFLFPVLHHQLQKDLFGALYGLASDLLSLAAVAVACCVSFVMCFIHLAPYTVGITFRCGSDFINKLELLIKFNSY
jgi:hypothetical protein